MEQRCTIMISFQMAALPSIFPHCQWVIRSGVSGGMQGSILRRVSTILFQLLAEELALHWQERVDDKRGRRRGCGTCNSGANVQHQFGCYRLWIAQLLWAECWDEDANCRSGSLEVPTLFLYVCYLDTTVRLVHYLRKIWIAPRTLLSSCW